VIKKARERHRVGVRRRYKNVSYVPVRIGFEGLSKQRLPGNDRRDHAWFDFWNLAVEEKSLSVVCYCVLIHPHLELRGKPKTGSEERLRGTEFECSAQVHGNRHKHSFRS
jgi:hypothetical protein